jgi:hypothetical protein
MQALWNHSNHIMFLCKVKNAVGKSTIAKQHQVKCTLVGEACTCTVCTVLRICYVHVHMFMWEGTEHSVFHTHGFQPHTGLVTTVCWCHYMGLCSCVPSLCSELKQFQRWSGFKRFCHPNMHTFTVAHSGWCWRDDAVGHLGRLYHF